MDDSASDRDASAEKLRQRLWEKMQAEREALREQEVRWATSKATSGTLAPAQDWTSSNLNPKPSGNEQESKTSVSPSQAEAEGQQGGEVTMPPLDAQHASNVPQLTDEPAMGTSATGISTGDAEASAVPALGRDHSEEQNDKGTSVDVTEEESKTLTSVDPETSSELVADSKGQRETASRPFSSDSVSDAASRRVAMDGSLASCGVSPVLKPADWSDQQGATDWTRDTPEVYINRIGSPSVDERREPYHRLDEKEAIRDRPPGVVMSSEPETSGLLFEWSTEERQQVEEAVQRFCVAAVAAYEQSTQLLQEAANSK
jgi:hypothetical protein